jgi:hypothetical protein
MDNARMTARRTGRMISPSTRLRGATVALLVCALNMFRDGAADDWPVSR